MKVKLQTIWFMTKCTFYGLCIQMLCGSMLIAYSGEAQNKSLEEIKLTVQFSNVELAELFSELESNTNFSFTYNDKQVDENQKLSLKATDESLYKVLRTISNETGLSFKRIDNNIFVKRMGEFDKAVQERSSVYQLADIEVSGKVIDENGQGLPGASVVIKSSSAGTTTDLDGNYKITVPDDALLVYSFVGYKTQEVLVGARSRIDLAMEVDAAQLEEIVVVGYGSQKKSDITGSTASVKGEDIAAMPVPTFDMALQGRAAGLLVTSTSGEPGGGVSIRIRGSNSVIGNNEPLIVLDGYPMPTGGEASNSGSNNNRGQGSNLLSFLNPSEIESVDILKDASATAIYGSRGANGVIIVTTKKGKAGGAQFNITSESGFNEIPTFPELMDGPTYAQWRNEAAVARGDSPLFDGVNRPLPADVTTTRWVDRILRTGINQRIQFDASGGSENTRYFISGNYLKNSGIVKFTDFSRGNIRLNLDTKLSERLSVTTTVNYARSKNNRTEEGTGLIINSGAVFTAYKNSPTSTSDDELDSGDGLSNFFADPLVQLRDNKDETYDESSIIGIQAKYNILDGLDFNIRTGTTSKNNRREIFWPNTTRVGRLVNSRAVYNNYSYQDMLLETYFTYDKAVNDNHNISLTGGYSWQENTERRLNTRVEDFPTDALTTDNIGFGLDAFIPTSQKLKRTLASFYFRSNYNYQSKYYLTFTGRADGSSVFGANKKWGIFPSAAVGWTISNEDFMEAASAISNFKFRASYGITGTQSIRPLQSLTLLGVANAAFNDALNAGLAPRQLGNPDLEWEKTKQLNLGFDLSLFADRMYANFDYYVKTTDDLLQNLPLPQSAGLNFIVSNTGSIENKGLELVIGGYPVDKQDFKWNTNLNWSRNRSIVKSLGETGADIFGPAPAVNIVSNPANIMRVGEVFGAFYGYPTIGLIQHSDINADGSPNIPTTNGSGSPGQWKFQDTDGSGVINNDDRIIVGDPTPDFIFGWNNDFTYKAFTLSVFFQGVVGNDVMNIDRLFLASGRTVNNALLDWYENRWTEENQHNNVRYPSGDAGNGILQPQAAVVEDGTYVRLKNVSLGYNVPTNNFIGLRNARIYVTATNLFTVTNYSGFDPEVNVFGGNNVGQGVDFGSYPRNRTYTLGVKIGF